MADLLLRRKVHFMDDFVVCYVSMASRPGMSRQEMRNCMQLVLGLFVTKTKDVNKDVSLVDTI